MSTTLVCPQGHQSDELDFCSVCGSKLLSEASPGTCPDCGAAREAGAGMFCEACGHNFITGAAGHLKEPSPAPLAPIPEPEPPKIITWSAEISIDPKLREDGSPDPPKDFTAQTINLSNESSLLGRRSDRRAIFPELALDADDAISHRHALLSRTADGGLVLRDIGSSNGTRLNGADVKPLVDMPLKDGDQITLGHWTRITVRQQP
jgi:hypothetical protein